MAILKTHRFKALKLHGATLAGFSADYSYPHPHTLYFLEGVDDNCKLQPEQLRAKMLMFAFGNAVACAHRLYGVRPPVRLWQRLEQKYSSCHFLCLVSFLRANHSTCWTGQLQSRPLGPMAEYFSSWFSSSTQQRLKKTAALRTRSGVWSCV